MKNPWREKLCSCVMLNFCKICRRILANREGSHLRVEERVHAILRSQDVIPHAHVCSCHKLACWILFLSRKLNGSVYPNCERGKCVSAELLFQVMPFGEVLISGHSTAPDITEAMQGLVSGWERQGLARGWRCQRGCAA